jgi:hypothetical protein
MPQAHLQPDDSTGVSEDHSSFLSRGVESVRVPPGLLSCVASLDGPHTLTLSATGRNRVGLLADLLELVHATDQAVGVDGGFARVVEGYAVIFLVLRLRSSERRKLDHLLAPLSAFKETAPGGVQCTPGRAVVLAVRHPDRPGLLAAVCRAIAAAGADIQVLEIEPFVDIPPGTDLLSGAGPISGPAVCDLTLSLALPTTTTPRDLVSGVTAVAEGEITAGVVD